MAGYRQRRGHGPKQAVCRAERRRAQLNEELAAARTPSELIGAAADFLRGVVKSAPAADADRVAAETVAYLRGQGESLLKLERSGDR